jgi:hypothetical protein
MVKWFHFFSVIDWMQGGPSVESLGEASAAQPTVAPAALSQTVQPSLALHVLALFMKGQKLSTWTQSRTASGGSTG